MSSPDIIKPEIVSHRQFSQRERLLLLSAILTGFALRLFRLGQDSLWYDETVSVVLARKTIPALLAHTAGDIHPPGYYLLLHGWQLLTTPTPNHGLEFLFAWPSLCFGMLAVALIAVIARRLFTPATAVIALWLAALHPYQIWYGQEVRMYTVGTALGLLALWALLNAVGVSHPQDRSATASDSVAPDWRWLLLYALAGAVGLYTLYYFVFLLIALNAIALVLLLVPVRRSWPTWRAWIIAQLAIILLWLPWLPIAWRQAIDPPVPPWRVAWENWPAILASSSEGISGVLVGQSVPLPTHWLWLAVGAGILVATLLFYAKQVSHKSATLIATLYLLIPILLIYGITAWFTPLYHVRYLVLYAPGALLLLAALLAAIHRRQPWIATVLFATTLTIYGWSLHSFWTAPRFASDDHRAAVAELADHWRPGDLILVNAGWAYTVLETYWPTELTGPDASIPPALGPTVRLVDYAGYQALGLLPLTQGTLDSVPAQPIIVRTGSVDGLATLGWGDPASDFFTISSTETVAALASVAIDARRIWHYRIYDTVNDPTGVIRTWLAAAGEARQQQPYSGRDFLQVELYTLGATGATATAITVPEAAPPSEPTLALVETNLLPSEPRSGTMLYLRSVWESTIGLSASNSTFTTDLHFSLRLYNSAGVLVAQQDQQPLLPPSAWAMETQTEVVLALPLPVALPPVTYSLQLIVYDGTTGEEQSALVDQRSSSSLPTLLPNENLPGLSIAAVTLGAAAQIPELSSPLARFDYIDLLKSQVWLQSSAATEELHLNLLWRPQPNEYRDTYAAQFLLVDKDGQALHRWQEVLGGWEYPSGEWIPALPVYQRSITQLPHSLAAGYYQVIMEVHRASDEQPIVATLGWGRTAPRYLVGEIIQE